MKQVIVVRTDVEMGKGKLCGQVAHASVSAAHKTIQKDLWDAKHRFDRWFNESNQTKIVLKVASEDELEAVARLAERAVIVVARIHDAGHTQLDPGTFTCIGLGPDEDDKIDSVTGHLKLL